MTTLIAARGNSSPISYVTMVYTKFSIIALLYSKFLSGYEGTVYLCSSKSSRSPKWATRPFSPKHAPVPSYAKNTLNLATPPLCYTCISGMPS
jgi:hypothetical protein